MWDKTQKKPIAAFLALTFLITWGGEFLLILLEHLVLFSLPDTVRSIMTYLIMGLVSGVGPLYSIVILLRKYRQITCFKDFFRRLISQKSTITTLCFILLFSAAMAIVNVFANNWLGNAWYMVIATLPLMIIGGGLEEIGWRGFLQPALEEKISFIPSALVVGFIWALWHYPLWLVQGVSQSNMNIVTFTLSCVMLSFALSAVYKSTRSVLACIIMHALVNGLGVVSATNYLVDAPNLKIMVIYLAEICFSIFIYYITDLGRVKKLV